MAAEISFRVLNMVRRRILEDPSVTNDVLFAAATEMDPDLQSLSMRQFNARYPLRVRRWELSDRTRILHPSGPLSKVAAENPATPVASRPDVSLALSDTVDGATDSRSQDGTPQSQPRDGAAQSQTAVAANAAQSEPPSLQARVSTPPPAEGLVSPVKPLAPTVSQISTSHLEAPPRALEEAAELGLETSSPAAAGAAATRPLRRRRATRRPADDARAEVILIMLRWATAIGQASGIPEVFATLSTVDDYVDHIAQVLDMP